MRGTGTKEGPQKQGGATFGTRAFLATLPPRRRRLSLRCFVLDFGVLAGTAAAAAEAAAADVVLAIVFIGGSLVFFFVGCCVDDGRFGGGGGGCCCYCCHCRCCSGEGRCSSSSCLVFQIPRQIYTITTYV